MARAHTRQLWRVRTHANCSLMRAFMDRQFSCCCNIDLDPAICGSGRRPRSTVDDGAAEGRDRSKVAIDGWPTAGVGACKASRARTRAEAPIHSGKKRPLRPALVCFAACMPQRRHVASQQRHTPFHGAFATCPSTLPPSTNRNRFCPVSPISVRYFWAQEQQPCPGDVATTTELSIHKSSHQ